MKNLVRNSTKPLLMWFLNLIPGMRARVAHYAWYRPAFSRTALNNHTTLPGTRYITFAHGREVLSAQHAGTQGALVFFVHGWGGHSGDFRKFVKAFVGHGFQAVLVDLPAHGKSSGRKTDIGQMADALLRFAEHFGQPYAVVAHSLGSTCATLAIRRGLAARYAVLLAPPSTFAGMADKVSCRFGYSPSVVSSLRQLLENDFGEGVWNEFSTVFQATRMKIPATIIHDISDEQVPVEEGRAVAMSWPKSEFFETTGLGHRHLLASESVISKTVECVNRHRYERTTIEPP